MSSNKIMVVEDNSATRRAVCNALTRSGHSVLEAPDGKTARELMRREHPRVVLQDLMLPDTDGFELVTQLRLIAGTESVSILAFSGFAAELLESRAATVEFDDIITKPIAPSRLVPIIEAHLPHDPTRDRFGRNRRVVCVDDDPLQLKLAAFRLQRLGFDVVTALDGRAALAAIRKDPPDLVISDVMMPGLDGFGLAIELRRDPAFQHLPLLLVTSSYVETADRDLAQRAGATDLVPRTPELTELFSAVRAVLARPLSRSPELPNTALVELEREHNARIVRQLEHQVALNNGLAKRCSALSSELTVLMGISETILDERDLDQALDDAISVCFDAGGISVGALYLFDDAGALSVRYLGVGQVVWTQEDLETLFGHPELMDEVLRNRRTVLVPSGVSSGVATELLARAQATKLMMVPLGHGGVTLGGLLMASRGRDLDPDDWRAFAYGVATQISHVVSLGRAYTARSQAEVRATQHAALLDAVFASVPDLIVQVDRAGIIRFSNRPTSLVGRMWCDTVPDPVRARAVFEAALATTQPTEHEMQLSLERTFLVHFGPVIEPSGGVPHVTSLVIVARDITEQKQAEIQLVISDRMASVGTLAAGVAHEINNPLTSVITNLDLASDELARLAETITLPIDLEDEMRDARHGAERVREIVRDLKMFSRSEEERSGPVDVDRVLDSTLRMAWNELRHRARIIKAYAKDLPQVHANESRLGQVFLNLLINAAHAIPEGNYLANEIRVTTELRGEHVIISIADTGSGIAHEVRPRLFTPFFTTKPVGVGTGLGLAISLKIVTTLGGTITFDSEVGHGTAFHVSLPALTAIELPVVSRVTTRKEARRGSVLVIDDDVQLGQAIRRYLSAYHDVLVVQSGATALALMAEGARYDVVLCDLMMPQITGMELFTQLAAFAPEQAERIVFLTGGAFTIAAREFLDASPNQRLDKPFDVKVLRRLVNEMITL
ncbi:MAG: response regulator [Proteobacteria bacterium]|nr:response regulator [Pseudomonadota bacterium]